MKYIYKILVVLLASLCLLSVALIVDLSTDSSSKGIVLEKRMNRYMRFGYDFNTPSVPDNYFVAPASVFQIHEYAGGHYRNNNNSNSRSHGLVPARYGSILGNGESNVSTSNGVSSISGFGRTFSKARRTRDYSGYLAAVGSRASYQVPAVDVRIGRKSGVAAPAPRDEFISPFRNITPSSSYFASPLLSVNDVNRGLTQAEGTGGGTDTKPDISYDEVTGGVTVPLGDALVPMLLLALAYVGAVAYRRFH